MNSSMQSDTWICRTMIVLGFILTVSVIAVITMILLGQSIPELPVSLGAVAAAGLIELSISPLNWVYQVNWDPM